ncbi:MAG: hypothetical protein ACRDAM_13285, partial [Casimicrobium sp.]
AGVRAIGIESIEIDQWSVYPGLAPHRPLFAVDMEDGGRHYVSGRTGEVVRDTSRFERGWNWIGSVTHWIYLTPIRSDGRLWHWVVVVASMYAIIVAVLGTVIGLMRYRRARYANGSVSPYTGWMRWHHLLGLAGAFIVLSWLVSGFLSMNPFEVFARINRADFDGKWRGASFANTSQIEAYRLPTPASTAKLREIEWIPNAAGAKALLRSAPELPSAPATFHGYTKPSTVARAIMLLSAKEEPLNITETEILAKASRLNSAEVRSVEKLDDYDLYYYGRHAAKPLPVWRVKFGDDAASWWHIDATSGELVNALNRSTRVERWLYSGLHSWDWLPLINRRPWAWDLPMIIALLIGTALSLTSIVIAWRRLFGRSSRRSSSVGSSSARNDDATNSRFARGDD